MTAPSPFTSQARSLRPTGNGLTGEPSQISRTVASSHNTTDRQKAIRYLPSMGHPTNTDGIATGSYAPCVGL